MNVLVKICIGLTLGIIIGSLLGIFKFRRRKTYSSEQISYTQNTLSKIATILKYVTFISLLLGLIWCLYFLIVGMFFPEKIEYATNMSDLIVAVLTVISIIFAFFEFVRRPND